MEINNHHNLPDDELVYILAAIGANTCISSYDAKQKAIADSFCNMNLKTIVNMWSVLNDQVKLRVINCHISDFQSWIESNKK